MYLTKMLLGLVIVNYYYNNTNCMSESCGMFLHEINCKG